MTSILWSNLCTRDLIAASPGHSKLFYFLFENTLMVLGAADGKLTFAKNFTIRDQGDLLYFSLACSRMIKPQEHWQLTLEGEPAAFEMPVTSSFSFQHQLQLPSLHILIARHRLCES